jgi:hypothetical protein
MLTRHTNLCRIANGRRHGERKWRWNRRRRGGERLLHAAFQEGSAPSRCCCGCVEQLCIPLDPDIASPKRSLFTRAVRDVEYSVVRYIDIIGQLGIEIKPCVLGN